ncbi:MAG: hypothetical protein V1645_00925 [archaeon]
MKKALISTSLGNNFTSPNHVAFVRTENGLEEKFVYELKAGQRSLFKAEYAPHTLEDVVGVLYDVIPRYKEDRDFLFITDHKEGREYEIPQLRYDIISSIFKSNPQLFTEQERREFEDTLFRVEGKEFGESTISAISSHLGEICKEEDLKYAHGSRVGWITKTYHIDPNNLDNAQIIAKALGNQSLLERAKRIAELPREVNPYFELTGAHRRYSRMLREVISTEGQPEKLEKDLLPAARVHECYLEWDKKVLQQFISRKIEKIVEAVIYGVKLIDTERKDGEDKPDVLFSKGFLSVDDEAKREELYNKLKFTKAVKSRSSKLVDDFLESYKILFELYQLAFEPFITLEDGLRKFHSKQPRDLRHLDIQVLDFINPFYSYDPSWYKECDMFTHRKIRELATDQGNAASSVTELLINYVLPFKQTKRREYRKEIKNSLPEYHPMYKLLSRIYSKSMFLKTYVSESSYINSMSSRLRDHELKNTRFSMVLGEQLPSRIFTKNRNLYFNWVNQSPKLYKSFYSSLMANKQYNKLVEGIRQLDRSIPIELTVFRSYDRFKRLDDKKSKLDKEEDKFMLALFDKYNVSFSECILNPFYSIREEYKAWATAQGRGRCIV